MFSCAKEGKPPMIVFKTGMGYYTKVNDTFLIDTTLPALDTFVRVGIIATKPEYSDILRQFVIHRKVDDTLEYDAINISIPDTGMNSFSYDFSIYLDRKKNKTIVGQSNLYTFKIVNRDQLSSELKIRIVTRSL